MCSSSTPAPATNTQKEQEKVQKTQADASATKASADTVQASAALGSRSKQTSLAGRDVKTAPRGLADLAASKKKTLLGE